MLYEDFEEALDTFRDDGGAMNYHEISAENHTPKWEVDDFEAIQETVDNVKRATIHALKMGGMTEEQIEQELEDWDSEDIEPDTE